MTLVVHENNYLRGSCCTHLLAYDDGMPTAGLTQSFGDELRRHRETRRFSQLRLATEAAVSQKHVSFLELGRSLPSREMVQHLGHTLDLSLRAQNALLISAGFAPEPNDANTAEPDFDVMAVLVDLIDTLGDLPAFVLDRAWNVLAANTAAVELSNRLLHPDQMHLAGNIARLFLDPNGAQNRLVDADQTASQLRDRLTRQLDDDPTNHELAAILEELPPSTSDRAARTTAAAEVIHFRFDDHDERYYMTLGSLVNPLQVIADEVQIETLLPADEPTRRFLKNS